MIMVVWQLLQGCEPSMQVKSCLAVVVLPAGNWPSCTKTCGGDQGVCPWSGHVPNASTALLAFYPADGSVFCASCAAAVLLKPVCFCSTASTLSVWTSGSSQAQTTPGRQHALCAMPSWQYEDGIAVQLQMITVQ